MRRSGGARRTLSGVMLGLLIATSLTGCIINYDPAVPYAQFINNYDESVVVTYEGTDPPRESTVPADDYTIEGLNECKGTGLSVRTPSGEVLGSIAEPACPHWDLTVNEDGSLTYAERGRTSSAPSR